MIDGPIHVEQAPVRIRHYFAFSLFSTLCLCPATGYSAIESLISFDRLSSLSSGLIALAYSIKSSAKADVKFHEKARLYARRALIWNLISVILIVLSFIAVIDLERLSFKI